MSMSLQNIGGTCKIVVLCAVIPRLYIRVRGANSLELLCSELNQVVGTTIYRKSFGKSH